MSFLRCVMVNAICLSGVLVGCGGAPLDNPNYLERNPNYCNQQPDRCDPDAARTISVSVSGASGPVEVSLGARKLNFVGDGTLSEGGFSANADVIAEIVSVSRGDQCYFSPSNQQQITAGAVVVVLCGAPAVAGGIKDFFTADDIEGARVTAMRDDDGLATKLAHFAAPSATYALENAYPGERLVLRIEADGYVPQTRIVSPSAVRPVMTENIFLVPVAGSDSQDPHTDMAFAVWDVTVLEIPAGGLVDGVGAPPVGKVTAEIALLDPGADPFALPGGYRVLNGSQGTRMASYGALSIRLTDSRGTALQLAERVVAELNVPLAPSASGVGPEAATVVFFDDDSGYWRDPVAVALVDRGGTVVYSASVTSLTTIIAVAETYRPVQVRGCLADSRGNRIIAAPVVSQGRDYAGLAYALTDGEGEFSVPARANSELLIHGMVGAHLGTEEVSTDVTTTVLMDCLVLDDTATTALPPAGRNPSDLDAHLFGPTPGI